jgi:1,4-dihydroxy-2-naphthoate octaprenyltransferase
MTRDLIDAHDFTPIPDPVAHAVWAFIRLTPAVPGRRVCDVLLGASIALYSGAALDLGLLVMGQLAVTCTQLMTHYANDYFDLEYDRANVAPTHWSGGSRVLVRGDLPPLAALIAALILAAGALVIAGWMGLADRPAATAVILLGIVLAAAYSAPPTRLHARGLGETLGAFIVSVLTPLTGFVVQTGNIRLLPLLAAVPLLPLQFAMLMGAAFPDAEPDAESGKRTLVVRLGEGSAWLYGAAILGAFVSLLALVMLGLPTVVAAALGLLAPLGAWQVIRVQRGDWRDPARVDSLAFGGISLLVGAALIEMLAFLALAGGWR